MQSSEVVTPGSFHTLGDLLRHLRHRLQMTQRDLSIAVGYNEAHISRLESNSRKLDRAVITARFVPALELEQEPQWVARLLELAEGRPPPPPADGPAPAAPVSAPALLATKLHVPPARAGRVARPHLLRRLDSALGAPLTLVAAPAGFGKSTLLAEWLASRAEPAAWLTLDEDDNDLATFVRYLVAALRQVAPAAGGETLAMLQSPPAPRALLAPLVNDLAALTCDVLLVLDDCHVLADGAAAEALGFLVERMPARLHLVIASRAEPALPLARLRARGLLLELRAADLRFDGGEAAAFLRGTMAVDVTDAEAASLEARAEGWPAGLQLAALALRTAPDRAAFVRAFAGSSRYVFDYLAGEVLDRQPAYLRHFLLQTAILDRFCGPLCDAVLGVAGDGPAHDSYSQVVLADLERRGLFLVALDDDRRWYRYHHLFAEALRARMASGSAPQAAAELHRRASGWFHQQGLADEAIQHAVRSGGAELVGQLVEQYLAIGLSRNDHRVWAWYAQVPPAVVGANPRLVLQAADLLARVHRYDEAVRLLEEAPALQPPLAPDVAAGAALMRARIARIRLDDKGARVWLDRVLALAPAEGWPLRATLALEHGLVACEEDALDEGLALLDEAAARFRAQGYDGDAIFALSQRLGVLLMCGRLREALAEATAAMRWLADMPEALAARVMRMHQARADALIELGRAAEATADLDVAWRSAAGSLEWIPAIVLCWRRARHAHACGDDDRALAVLEEGRQRFAPRAGADVDVFVAGYVAQVQLWRGDVGAAVEAIRASGTTLETPAGRAPFDVLVLARCLIAQGRREPTGPYLAQAHALIERCSGEIKASHTSWQIVLHALRALVAHARGDETAALAAVGRALELGEPEGFTQVFVDEGAPMADLLRAALAQGIQPAACRRLLAAATRA